MPKREVWVRSRKEAFEKVRRIEMLKGHFVPLSARPIKYEVTYRHSKRRRKKK